MFTMIRKNTQEFQILLADIHLLVRSRISSLLQVKNRVEKRKKKRKRKQKIEETEKEKKNEENNGVR